MIKLDLSTVPKKLKPNPLFKGMSDYLKDPKNFDKVELELIKILQSNHKHKTASAYVKCQECQSKRDERTKRMKKIGFKSLQQYMGWKKIHTIIKEKKSFQLK